MSLLSVFTLATASCCFMIPIGYEFNIQNSVYSTFSNLTNQEWTAFKAMWPTGAVLGSALSPLLAERFSRKFAIFAFPCAFMLMGGVTTANGATWTLLIGRFLFAVGAGMVLTILPVYSSEICNSALVGGSINAAFWLGCALASGLGLDTVLGVDGLRPYFALIAPFFICLTLILSPLFPETISANYPLLKSRNSEESVLIESWPQPWSWRDRECKKLAITSLLVGSTWASFAPMPLYLSARPILTLYLNYSPQVAGAIEACVASIYACLAMLSFILQFAAGRKEIYICIAYILSSIGLSISITFALLAQYGSINGWTGKMGFLFSFLLCAVGFQTVLAPNFFTAPFHFCKKHHWRIRCYALQNVAGWSTFLIWTLIFGESAKYTGGWSLMPFLVISTILPISAYLYWKKQHPKMYGKSESSFFTALSGNDSSYGTFESAKSDADFSNTNFK